MSGGREVIAVTGATGFLGSHLAIRLLEAHPEARILCLARRTDSARAIERVHTALRQAALDSDIELTERGLERVEALENDLLDSKSAAGWSSAVADGGKVSAFWNCAASVSFVESSTKRVKETNIEGVRASLQMAKGLGAEVFNHISTAYVAGRRTDVSPEALISTAGPFHNVYEESKCEGERLVDDFARTHDLDYRIFRPSIIVGHSQTLRGSTETGFYHVLRAVADLCDQLGPELATLAGSEPLEVPIDPQARINAISVDVVVDEMLDAEALGSRTLNQVFHITSDAPIALASLMQGVLQILGIEDIRVRPVEQSDSPLAILFERQMNILTPYLSLRTEFSRAKARRYGYDRHQQAAGLTSERLLEFAAHYLRDRSGLQKAGVGES